VRRQVLEIGGDQLALGALEPALDHLLGAGAQCRAVSQWMSRHPVSGMDRYVLAGQTLA
jgi:hypothetical protein